VSFRRRLEDWSEAPATYGVAASWILVYVIMLAGQWLRLLPSPDAAMFAEMGPLGIGAISEASGHLFGSWNSAEILTGQFWRAVCATFIHFGVIHIALNTFGLIQLGRLIEEWYGPRLFVMVVITTGFFGNFLAALARPVMAQPSESLLFISSGGGSTVVFGLIGLVAVVGKRSRSRMGQYLYKQMIGLLLFNFMIGLTIPQIDNFAHAGGALSGALLGLMHYRLIKINESRRPLAGLILFSMLFFVGICVACQVWADQVESQVRRQEVKITLTEKIDQSLEKLTFFYKNRMVLGLNVFQIVHQKPIQLRGTPWFPPMMVQMPSGMINDNHRMMDQEIDLVDALINQLGILPVRLSWEPVRAELRLALSRPPTARDLQGFEKKMAAFRKQLSQIFVEIIRLREIRESRLVLFRLPLPGIGWKGNQPYLLKIGPPDDGPISNFSRIRNRSADLPPGVNGIMPRPEIPAAKGIN
jgi:rhomboid protease GluP